MQKDRTLVLINAAAGKGKAVNGLMEIITALAQHGTDPVVYPVIPGTGLISEQIMKEHDGQFSRVLCSGGDGTLNHVVRGVMEMENKPVIGYIPAGSTNDFAVSLRIPSEFSAALDAAVSGEPFTYDIGMMNDSYFNYIAAFGAFTSVSYATNQRFKNMFGHAAYLLTAMSEISDNINYSCRMHIDADGEQIDGDFIFGAVCNSVSVAGKELAETKNVSLDDGRFELALIKTPANPIELKGIVDCLKNGSIDSPNIIFRQIKNVKLSSDADTSWTIDGEFGGTCRETEIRVIPQAVTIMVPKNDV